VFGGAKRANVQLELSRQAKGEGKPEGVARVGKGGRRAVRLRGDKLNRKTIEKKRGKPGFAFSRRGPPPGTGEEVRTAYASEGGARAWTK